MTRAKGGATLCPSAPAQPGALLIGVVGPGGRVGNLLTPIPIDDRFIELAQRQGSVEARFRLASPCQQARCAHWNGHCELIGELQEAGAARSVIPEQSVLRPCGIRSSCRWYRQEGGEACAVCSIVVSDQQAVRSFEAAKAASPGTDLTHASASAGRFDSPRP